MRSLDPKKFQARLHHEIPISAQMQIEVIEVSEDRAQVKAPLAPNINHKKTAFGGSLNSLAVASCWSLITGFVELQGLEADYIVIQNSEISYLKPIDSDFSATAEWESPEDQRKFLETLKKHQRARAILVAKVSGAKGEGAVLKARFVAQLLKD